MDTPGSDDHTLPCRPTVACTADIVPAGELEVEAGGISRRTNSGEARSVSFPVLLKQSFTSFFQLQVGTNGYSDVRLVGAARYVDNVAVGPKFHLVDQSTYVPAFAVSGALSIPTAAESGYVRTYDALFTAYATKDFGPLHADLNVGYDAWRLEHVSPQTWVALALSTALGGPFGAMVESYVFSDAHPVATRDGGLLFALSLAPKPWLTFDVGGDVGYYPTERSYSVFAGVTMIPVVLWRHSEPKH